MPTTEKVQSITEFEVEQHSEGHYIVKELPKEVAEDFHSGNRKEISIDVKIVKITGYYDPDTREIGVYPTVAGLQIGNGYFASLDRGIQIQCVLVAYNGGIRFYKNGGKLRVEINLKPLLPWGDDINAGIDLFDI